MGRIYETVSLEIKRTYVHKDSKQSKRTEVLQAKETITTHVHLECKEA